MMNTNIMCFLGLSGIAFVCACFAGVLGVCLCACMCVCVCDGDLQIGCLHVSGRVVCD